MEPNNKTKADAFTRINDAKISSFVDCTDEYLCALRQQIAIWDQEIREEMAIRMAKAKQAARVGTL